MATDERDIYLNAKVSKDFPPHGRFPGVVRKIEKNDDDDDRCFFIRYEDNDREWVNIEELKRIVVKEKGKICYEQDSNSKKKRGPSPKQTQSTRGKATNTDHEAAQPKEATAGKENKRPRRGAAPLPPAEHPGLTLLINTAVAESQLRDGEGDAQAGPSNPAHNLAPASPTAHDSKGALLRTLEQVKETAEEAAESHNDIVRLFPATATRDNTQEGPTKMNRVVVVNGLVFMAAQVARDLRSPAGNTYEGQIKQIFRQMDEELSAAGTNKKRLVQCTIYIRNFDDGLEVFESLWDGWVDPKHLPCRSLVQADMIDPNALVEMGAVAAGAPRHREANHH